MSWKPCTPPRVWQLGPKEGFQDLFYRKFLLLFQPAAILTCARFPVCKVTKTCSIGDSSKHCLTALTIPASCHTYTYKVPERWSLFMYVHLQGFLLSEVSLNIAQLQAAIHMQGSEKWSLLNMSKVTCLNHKQRPPLGNLTCVSMAACWNSKGSHAVFGVI
jgi:hypothetical protein